MKKYITLLLSYSIFFYCCQSKESHYAKIIRQNLGKDYCLLNLSDTNSYKTIFLETNADALIGSYDKIMMNDSLIFVLDKEKTRSLFIYDHNGHFKNKISKNGRGVGEYVFLEDANLNGDTLLIIDRGTRKLLYYDLHGNFLNEYHFKSYFSIPFTVLGHDKLAFYFGMPKQSKENAEIVVTDLLFQVDTQYIYRKNLTQKAGRFHFPQYFTQNKNGTFFIPTFDDKIYRFSNSGIEPIFDFQFKDFMFSFDEVSSEPIINQNRKYAYFNKFYMTDEGIFVCSNSIGAQPVNLCGNIFTKELNTWNHDVEIVGNYKEYFITTCYASEFTKIFPQVNAEDNDVILLIDGKRLLERNND